MEILSSIISNYQYEILMVIGSLFSLFFERENLETNKDKIVYVLIGIFGAFILFPFILEYTEIDTDRVYLIRAIAFFVGTFTSSFIKAVKRTLDNLDFWEFIKGKFGG